ncbi:hypothetical protein Dda_8865 [Drechslerella dactyloides]|uniref:Zn(2)-C6 fungal-type domain-containing protein n=1 Tax=Drechslerella dactyloides TaxID=74499 RepID=A0AAD6IRS8_DREDA|nr:hypothetical protein Dda_8865 [Drechslerella dactyloides]
MSNDVDSEIPVVGSRPTLFGTAPQTTVLNFRRDIPADSNVNPQPSVRVRRFHHKTRTGCKECKQKRRKCNEGKPSCQGCLKAGNECHYEENIPPKVQPKNRKRPTRKPPQNRFVFVEFDKGARRTVTNPDDSDSASSNQELLRWQSAPSTCLLQGGLSLGEKEEIGFEVETLVLFRNFTYRTLPFLAYNKEMWQQQPYLYNVIVATGAAHRRFLRREATRNGQEVSHFHRAIADFRSAISDSSVIATMDRVAWIAVLVTAALLSMYIMSCPVENFEVSCDTYFSLSRGAMNMLIEATRRGVKLPIPSSRLKQRAAVAETPFTAEFPGLDYAASGDDKAVGDTCAMRLAAILTALSEEDRHKMDSETVLNLLKMMLEWTGSPEATLLQQFRMRQKKAYLVMAHFYGGLWKIKEIIHSLCSKDRWREENGLVDSYWWLLSPRGLCKGFLRLLQDEPSERIAWVEDLVRELDGGWEPIPLAHTSSSQNVSS